MADVKVLDLGEEVFIQNRRIILILDDTVENGEKIFFKSINVNGRTEFIHIDPNVLLSSLEALRGRDVHEIRFDSDNTIEHGDLIHILDGDSSPQYLFIVSGDQYRLERLKYNDTLPHIPIMITLTSLPPNHWVNQSFNDLWYDNEYSFLLDPIILGHLGVISTDNPSLGNWDVISCRFTASDGQSWRVVAHNILLMFLVGDLVCTLSTCLDDTLGNKYPEYDEPTIYVYLKDKTVHTIQSRFESESHTDSDVLAIEWYVNNHIRHLMP